MGPQSECPDYPAPGWYKRFPKWDKRPAWPDNKGIVNKNHLRLLLDEKRWDEIETIFGFTPQFKILPVSGEQILDVTTCPIEFLKAIRGIPKTVRSTIPVACRIRKPPQPKRLLPRKLGGPEKPSLREILYEKQEGFCHYCAKIIPWVNWTIDHKTPISRGGTERAENKIGSCKKCNNAKGSMTEEEFRGCSSMAEREVSNLETTVQSRSLAPIKS